MLEIGTIAEETKEVARRLVTRLRKVPPARGIESVLTPGERHEAPVFPRLLERGAIKRPGRGRPRLRPRRIVGDKGYSSRAIRAASSEVTRKPTALGV